MSITERADSARPEQSTALTDQLGLMASLKELIRHINEDRLLDMAAELAYHLLLSLAPMLIFTFAILGLFGKGAQLEIQILYYARNVLPPETLKLLSDMIAGIVHDASGGLAIAAILGALWTATNGADVVLRGLNRAYNFNDPNISFLKQKWLSLVVVLTLGFGMLVASNLLVFGDLMLDTIDRYVTGISTTTELLVNVVRWSLIVVLTTLFAGFVYTKVPSALGKLHLRDTLPGAIVFVSLWIALSMLFSLYVQNMGSYSQVYGPLGAIVVLLIWLYLTALMLLIGGEVNALMTPPDRTNSPTPRRFRMMQREKP